MTVATVTQVVGRTMWVLLDGYKNDSVEHIYDVESYDLYPVGWCSMNGHPLLTPRIQRKNVICFLSISWEKASKIVCFLKVEKQKV